MQELPQPRGDIRMLGIYVRLFSEVFAQVVELRWLARLCNPVAIPAAALAINQLLRALANRKHPADAAALHDPWVA